MPAPSGRRLDGTRLTMVTLVFACELLRPTGGTYLCWSFNISCGVAALLSLGKPTKFGVGVTANFRVTGLKFDFNPSIERYLMYSLNS